MIPYKKKSFLHLQKRNSSLHPRENLLANSLFGDHIQGQASNYYPSATSPQTPLSATTVQHWEQGWNIGSTTSGLGVYVQDDTLQKYIDHAGHLGIRSPAL